MVGISQPTFLPWLGYFSLIDAVDSFVFLDDVAYSHQSWQNRNRVRVKGGSQWVSLPVRTSGRTGQLLREVEIENRNGFPKKQIQTLQQLYGRSPNWESLGSQLVGHMSDAANHLSLCRLNVGIIRTLLDWLEIKTRIIFSSDFPGASSKSERLAAITESLGGSTYLTTPGSVGYLSEDFAPFVNRGIAVEAHTYSHPTYQQQFEPFFSHMSILDLVFSEEHQVMDVIRSGRPAAWSQVVGVPLHCYERRIL